MVLDHSRLAPIVQNRRTQISLQCPICPASRTTSETETFEQFRKRELREAKAAATQAAETQRETNAQAAKQRTADAQRLALQREYIRFWSHQLRAGTPEILSRQRWESLPPGTRERILQTIAKDPTVQVSE
jgi:signal transduction histidine kinase